MLSAEALARRWLRLAEVDRASQGHGPLGAPDEQAIALRVAQMCQDLDLSGSGTVREEEWVHGIHLLPTKRIASQIAVPLSVALASRPRALMDLQDIFQHADELGTGRLGFQQVANMYSIGNFRTSPSMRDNRLLSPTEIQLIGPDRLARELVEAMDVDGDAHVSYGEFVAYCTGRRKVPVYLYMYDLSKGFAQLLSPWVLGDGLHHIWHTGVVVFGKEYFFAKDAVWDHPGKTDFGVPTKEVFIGYTLWGPAELHGFICNELKPVFHRDTYDAIGNNCNHFADRLCMWLTGNHVPEEVTLQTERLMKMAAVRALRPALNRALRDHVAARTTTEQQPPPASSPSAEARTAETPEPTMGKKKSEKEATCLRAALRRDEEVPVGSVVAVQESWGCAHGIFGVVSDPPLAELQLGSRTSKPAAECNGCSLPTFAVCCRPSEPRVMQDHLLDERPLIWVRYFELTPPSTPDAEWRGRVRLEGFPRERLSRVSPEESVELPCYATAVAYMAQSAQFRCRSSRQAAAGNLCRMHRAGVGSGPRASRGSAGRPIAAGLEAMRPRSVHEPEECSLDLDWAETGSDDQVYLL